ncbi:MAG: UDP-3-O-(3-hydroxymyristoyl)glucosamine N-acyltransferase [Rudaea sp.]
MTHPAHHSLASLAEQFGLGLRGDASKLISGVGTLAAATPDQLSFLANLQYRKELAASHAGVVVLREDDADVWPGNALIAKDPYVAFAKIAALYERLPAAKPGVHPSAVVAPSARVAASASIGPLCVIEDDAVIDDGVIVGSSCVVGSRCLVGAQSRLMARVTLVANVTLGKRVLIHSGAVLGADGFGLAFERDHWIKVPQLGGVRVGDDCEIGANTTVDRGALDDTVLEEDVRLDNQIQIAHNVHIGAHTAMAGCSAIAGSAKIGRYCQIGGGAGILGHVTIADNVRITAKAMITQSIHSAGDYSSGMPAQESAVWRRNAARFRHLDELFRRVKALEKVTKP